MKFCKDCKHWLPKDGPHDDAKAQEFSRCGRYTREDSMYPVVGGEAKARYADTCRMSGPCGFEGVGFEPKEGV